MTGRTAGMTRGTIRCGRDVGQRPERCHVRNSAGMATHTGTRDLRVIDKNLRPASCPRPASWRCVMAVIAQIGGRDVHYRLEGFHAVSVATNMATRAGTRDRQVINLVCRHRLPHSGLVACSAIVRGRHVRRRFNPCCGRRRDVTTDGRTRT